MVVHDALADGGLELRYAGPARRDHAAGLVACDEGFGIAAQAERLLRFARRRPVELEIRTAHARGLHLDDDLARTRRGVGKIADFDFLVAEEHRAAHA